MKRTLLTLAVLLMGAAGPAVAQPARWGGTADAAVGPAGNQKPTRFFAELWQLNDGGMLTLTQRGRRVCTGVFAPAAAPGQMEFLGATCPEIKTMALASGPQGALEGALEGSFVLDGNQVAFALQPEPLLAAQRPAMPSAPIDIRGLTLAGTAADALGAIEKVSGATDAPSFAGNAANPHWEVKGKDDSTYVLFTTGEGPAAVPAAVIRKWAPPAGQQPTLGALKQSLLQKYGPPSAEISPFGRPSERPAGLLWSYDLAGRKLEGAAARYCSFRDFSSDPRPAERQARPLPSVFKFWMNRNTSGIPDLPIGHVPGCGYQLSASWLTGLDDNRLVEVFGQSLVDPQAALGYISQAEIARTQKRLAPLIERFRAAKAGAAVNAPL